MPDPNKIYEVDPVTKKLTVVGSAAAIPQPSKPGPTAMTSLGPGEHAYTPPSGAMDPRYSSEAQRPSFVSSFVEALNPAQHPGALAGLEIGSTLGGPLPGAVGWAVGSAADWFARQQTEPELTWLDWAKQTALETPFVYGAGMLPRAIGTIYNMAKGRAIPHPVRSLATKGSVAPTYTSRADPTAVDVGDTLRRGAQEVPARDLRDTTYQQFRGTAVGEGATERAADITAQQQAKAGYEAIMPTPPPYSTVPNVAAARAERGKAIRTQRAAQSQGKVSAAFAPIDELSKDEANVVNVPRSVEQVNLGKGVKVSVPTAPEPMAVPINYREPPNAGQPPSYLKDIALGILKERGIDPKTLKGAVGPESLLYRLVNDEQYVMNVPLRDALRDLSYVAKLKRRAFNAARGNDMPDYGMLHDLEEGLFDAIEIGIHKAPNVSQTLKDSFREVLTNARNMSRAHHQVFSSPEARAALSSYTRSGIEELMGNPIALNHLFKQLGGEARQAVAWEHMNHALQAGMQKAMLTAKTDASAAQAFYEGVYDYFMRPKVDALREVFPPTFLQQFEDWAIKYKPSTAAVIPAPGVATRKGIMTAAGEKDPYDFVKAIGSDAEKLSTVRQMQGSDTANQYAAKYLEDLVRRGNNSEWLAIDPEKRLELCGGAADKAAPAVREALDKFFAAAKPQTEDRRAMGVLMRELSYIPHLFPTGPIGIVARLTARLEGRYVAYRGSRPGALRRGASQAVRGTGRAALGAAAQATAKGTATAMHERWREKQIEKAEGKR